MSTTVDESDSDSSGYADEPRPPPRRKPSLEIRIPDHKVLNVPERYRLSSRIGRDRPRSLAEGTVRFRFGTRTISATCVVPNNTWFPHLRRLHLHPSSFERFVQRVTNLLPAFIGVHIRTAFPEWFLPRDIILKSEKEHNTELFDTEVQAYKQLVPVQGVLVPRCYGSVSYKGLRSLLLQDIAGVSLREPAGLTLSLPELSSLLQDCHRELHSHNVHQGDPQLGNFLLVGGKLMAIDFEMAEFDLTAWEKALFMKTNVLGLVNAYVRVRKSELEDGSLEVD